MAWLMWWDRVVFLIGQVGHLELLLGLAMPRAVRVTARAFSSTT